VYFSQKQLLLLPIDLRSMRSPFMWMGIHCCN